MTIQTKKYDIHDPNQIRLYNDLWTAVGGLQLSTGGFVSKRPCIISVVGVGNYLVVTYAM